MSYDIGRWGAYRAEVKVVVEHEIEGVVSLRQLVGPLDKRREGRRGQGGTREGGVRGSREGREEGQW